MRMMNVCFPVWAPGSLPHMLKSLGSGFCPSTPPEPWWHPAACSLYSWREGAGGLARHLLDTQVFSLGPQSISEDRSHAVRLQRGRGGPLLSGC